MKNLNFLAVLITAICGFSHAQTYQNNTPTPGAATETRLSGCESGVQPGVQMSNITVPLTGTVGDPTKITIELGITSGWAGDVQIDLIAPSGDAMTLIRRMGATSNTGCGNSGDFVATNLLTFNSANTAPINLTGISGAIVIPGGFYAPTYGTAKYPGYFPKTMDSFLMGQNVSGIWRLVLYDFGTGDEAILDNWKISFAPGATLKTANVNVFQSAITLKQNPVGDQLLVNISESYKTLSFEIYDASGKLLKTEKISGKGKDLEINIHELSSGMYLLLPIKDGERQKTLEFIKK